MPARALVSALLLSGLAAQDPVFAAPERLAVDKAEPGAVLHVDIDGDERRDLLTGNRVVYVRFNEGTDDRPRFGSRSVLQAGGAGFQAPDR